MKLTEILLAALASMGTMVTATPVPDNQVAGLGNNGQWDVPVGYVCCKSIDRDGCHGCDFDKACPKDDVSKCPTGGFCCGFPAGVYPIPTSTPTPTSTHKSSNILETGTTYTTPGGIKNPQVVRDVGEGNYGTPMLYQWCSSDNNCENYMQRVGCANSGDCGGNSCCQIWSWG